MPKHAKDISDWDKTFTQRWQAALKREFGTGNVAAHRLSQAGINPSTVKAWLSKGGHPTIANLCLVARAARDPTAFIVEVCGDEPWARELGVTLQRRRLEDAEVALSICQAGGGEDPVQVIRALAGTSRQYRFVTDTGTVTQPLVSPEDGVRRMLGMTVIDQPVTEYVIRDLGWIIIEEAADQPLVVHCHAIMVSDHACDSLMSWLDQNVPRLGVVMRVFITGWASFCCANLWQVWAELTRIKQMRAFSLEAGRDDVDGAANANTVRSERRNLQEAPAGGAQFYTIWEQTGGIVDDATIQNIADTSLFDLAGIYGMQDQQFRVGFVGPHQRIPVGVTRKTLIGRNLLEVNASQGLGAMITAHFALAAHERTPLVHRIRLPGSWSYRRVSFPIFDHSGRKIIAVIGFTDARATGNGA
ncbi:hypothetical protein [Rhodospira trueperi]|uniref:Uncharacterized protein n=1 Tax=Rhodospira trueperi TaxID=69960 RepID=A0A1G6XPA3_9PROT|nr:hypothetical protein [Rhodospira trueperi]SDD79593.1 hypothetical protein SAMN05421720_101564 [Rhodospira trueperi]